MGRSPRRARAMSRAPPPRSSGEATSGRAHPWAEVVDSAGEGVGPGRSSGRLGRPSCRRKKKKKRDSRLRAAGGRALGWARGMVGSSVGVDQSWTGSVVTGPRGGQSDKWKTEWKQPAGSRRRRGGLARGDEVRRAEPAYPRQTRRRARRVDPTWPTASSNEASSSLPSRDLMKLCGTTWTDRMARRPGVAGGRRRGRSRLAWTQLGPAHVGTRVPGGANG